MLNSEDQLLRLAKAGDRTALEELLLRHGPPIRNGLEINRKWRSMIEPDDVMQVTYFEAFEHIDGFSGDTHAFPRWLRQIAENNLRDAVQWLERNKRPQPENRVTDADQKDGVMWLYETVAGAGTSPSHQAARNEVRLLLDDEIDRLPEAYADVLRSIFIDGRSVADISKRLGKTRGAVHLLRIRAIDRLRNRLGSGSQFFSHYA